MASTTTQRKDTTIGNLVSFDGYIQSLGKTRSTGWRYRRDGLLETVNIFGKLYITRDEIARFEKRAMDGEFHKEAKTPAMREVA